MARPRAGLHVWMLQTELIPNLPGCGCERVCRGRTWRGAITARPDLALCGKRGAFGCSVWKRFRCFFSWSLRTLPRRSRGARAHAADLVRGSSVLPSGPITRLGVAHRLGSARVAGEPVEVRRAPRRVAARPRLLCVAGLFGVAVCGGGRCLGHEWAGGRAGWLGGRLGGRVNGRGRAGGRLAGGRAGA